MTDKKSKEKSNWRDKNNPYGKNARSGLKTGNASGQDEILSLEHTQDELLEVLDQKMRPLLLMPRKQALRQKLTLRIVLIAVRNQENKLYIHQRSEGKSNYTGQWGVSVAGYVKAGESLLDAALRELEEELEVTGLPLKQIATAAPTAETDNSLVTLFLSRPAYLLVHPDPKEISSGMFVDEDELRSLLETMPENIAPSLRWAARQNLFR